MATNQSITQCTDPSELAPVDRNGNTNVYQSIIKKNLQKIIDACTTEMKNERTIEQISKDLLIPILKTIYKEVYPYLLLVLLIILILLTLSVGIIILLLYILKKITV